VRFVKTEGAGNDYVLVETFSQRVDDAPALSRRISDRNTGIGSDGLLLVGPPDAPPAGTAAAHARMRIFNADGSEGRMCGNGLRCVVRWLIESGRAPAQGARVQTAAGLRHGAPLPDGRYEIELGEPDFARAALGLPGAGDAQLPLPAGVRGDPPAAFGVSVGNPHLVLRVAAPEAEDLRAVGTALSALVPDGANVHLLAVRGRDTLVVRPWERGSGATQACGTGAVASAVVARRQGWIDADVVTVAMPGGELRVRWSGAGPAFLAGPAQLPFRGEWDGP
jgi:diaminopimelate epimerase